MPPRDVDAMEGRAAWWRGGQMRYSRTFSRRKEPSSPAAAVSPPPPAGESGRWWNTAGQRRRQSHRRFRSERSEDNALRRFGRSRVSQTPGNSVPVRGHWTITICLGALLRHSRGLLRTGQRPPCETHARWNYAAGRDCARPRTTAADAARRQGRALVNRKPRMDFRQVDVRPGCC